MLIEVAAIQSLKARYFRTLDTKDWAAHEALFAPDLIADMREATLEYNPDAVTHGASAYVNGLAPLLEHVSTVHHGHMPEIEILSETSARGTWAMEDTLWVSEGSVLPFRKLHGFGHYHETYVKRDGAWRIATIRLTRLHVEVS